VLLLQRVPVAWFVVTVEKAVGRLLTVAVVARVALLYKPFWPGDVK